MKILFYLYDFLRNYDTMCAGSHNLITKCHNITTGCYNFFKIGEIFSSFKILNAKVKLWALNVMLNAY